MSLFPAFAVVLVILSTIPLLIFINILQNGMVHKRTDLPSVLELVGKSRQDITVKDLLDLKKHQIFKLFQILPPVDPKLLDSEYRAINLPQGILVPLIAFITDHLFGPGKWVGKGFTDVDSTIEGYNLFVSSSKTHRARPFKVYTDHSEIDGRKATHLDYRDFNHDFIAGSMRDEIRQVNEQLFLGMGKTTWGLGKFNPAHFILYRQ